MTLASIRVQMPDNVPVVLLKEATALRGGSPEDVEELAGRVLALADKWEGGEDLEAALEVDEDEVALVDAD